MAMNQADDDQEIEDVGFSSKTILTGFLTTVFILLVTPLSKTFPGRSLSQYIFVFFFFWSFTNVLFLINRKPKQHFDIKKSLKYAGFIVLGLLVFHNVDSLLFPDANLSPQPIMMPIGFVELLKGVLVFGSIFLIIGLGFHFVHKITKN